MPEIGLHLWHVLKDPKKKGRKIKDEYPKKHWQASYGNQVKLAWTSQLKIAP